MPTSLAVLLDAGLQLVPHSPHYTVQSALALSDVSAIPWGFTERCEPPIFHLG